MSEFAQDRETERQRYNNRAAHRLGAELGPDGAESVNPLLRRPYLVYEQHIRTVARPGLSVLDLCCGDGVHSLTAARAGATVTATDLADLGLQIAARRAARAGLPLVTVTANAEALPFPDGSFDVVTCAGSLSYVDLERLLCELRRLLRPGGAFVFVDSLNHNPLYRLNRRVHLMRGLRSRSTLERMPTLATLERIRADYPDLKIGYYGLFSFMAPILRPFGHARATAWLDSWDAAFPRLNRFAFKVVGCGRRPMQ